jgi:hypothetical protein
LATPMRERARFDGASVPLVFSGARWLAPR